MQTTKQVLCDLTPLQLDTRVRSQSTCQVIVLLWTGFNSLGVTLQI